ncbi:MAG: MFS transporter [Chloroflexota bacterium]
MRETEEGRGFYYGWLVLVAAFFITALTFASGFSFGVFLTPFRESLGASSAAVSGAYSLCTFIYTGLAPFTGWGVDRYGPRATAFLGGLFMVAGLLLTRQVQSLWQLYATYALIGVGMSAAYTPLMTTVSRWFTRRRGLAVGIVSAGIGAGPLIMAPLARYLTEIQGWRFAFLVMGLAAALIVPLAFLLRRSPPKEVSAPNSPPERRQVSYSPDFSLREAVGTRAFWLFALMYFLVGVGLQMVNAHIVTYSEVKGISPLAAAAVLSTISGSSIIGKVSTGIISDRMGRRRVLTTSVLLEGLMILGMVGAPGAFPLFAAAVFFGFGYGGHSTSFPAIIGEMLGLTNMGAILGAAVFFWGIGGAIGPTLAGRIFDLTGDYAYAFAIGAGAMLGAVVASLFLKTPRKKG